MPQTLLDLLERRHAAGALKADPAQTAAARRLDALASNLEDWRPPRRGLLAGILGSGNTLPPRGLYIHGKVGRGKTMLMDLFHETVRFSPRRRVHFHAFMAEVHTLIGDARKTVAGDPIPFVASRLAEQARLLCFDEFHVTDIADAMILGRLFNGLFEHQVVVVATSNVAPGRLYWQGLNRQLFLPTIAKLEAHMEVLELAAARDFRLEKLTGQRLYFTPADAVADAGLRAHFVELTGVERGAVRQLDVNGRKVAIAEAAEGVAFVDFRDLCEKPLGASDYLALAEAFHTVIIRGVPILTRERRAEARRFIMLIDTLYDIRTCLIVSAEAEPDALHPAGDEAFLFERTASRLIEMRSAAYLADRETATRPAAG